MAGLGRGLSALLSDSKKAHEEKNQIAEETVVNTTSIPAPSENIVYPKTDAVIKIKTDLLKASIYQPRKNFNEESLNELALSIKEHGLLEPLLVKKDEDGKYAIVCGERRYRACKLAEIEEIPCLVREDLATNSYAIALIENIQREDLNPLEQAVALSLMMTECQMSQEDLAKTLGKSRSSITNILRLNNLHDDVKSFISSGQLDLGHAKVLLGLDVSLQSKAASIVIKKDMTVRQTELFVKEIKEQGDEAFETKKIEKPAIFNDIEESLCNKLNGIKVKISGKDENKGKLSLSYSSKEQLEEILTFFGVKNS